MICEKRSRDQCETNEHCWASVNTHECEAVVEAAAAAAAAVTWRDVILSQPTNNHNNNICHK